MILVIIPKLSKVSLNVECGITCAKVLYNVFTMIVKSLTNSSFIMDNV